MPGKGVPEMNYTVSNGRVTLTAATHGAELSSIVLDGQERIWGADPAVWARHAPMCFPFCGYLEDGTFVWKGRTFSVPERHGFARDLDHTLVEQGPGSLHFHLSWPGDEQRWPWAFTMDTVHALKENGTVTSVTATNSSEEPMPVQFGFHPAFVCPFVPGSSVEEYQFRFESGRVIPLTRNLFDNDSIPFEDTGAWVRLEHAASGAYVQVDTAAFPVVLLWSKPGVPGFVCIEPWDGFPGPGRDLEKRPWTRVLAPGESHAWKLDLTFG